MNTGRRRPSAQRDHRLGRSLSLPQNGYVRARRLTLALIATAALCGQSATKAHAWPGDLHLNVLRLDAIGKGTGPTPIFYVPVHRDWGIAWRYRCPGHTAELDMLIWEVINAVELPYTLIAEHGTRGSGYRMETGQTSGITAPNGQQAGEVLSLHVKTTCLWHVRVIAGSATVVRRWIPRLVARSSWTKG